MRTTPLGPPKHPLLQPIWERVGRCTLSWFDVVAAQPRLTREKAVLHLLGRLDEPGVSDAFDELFERYPGLAWIVPEHTRTDRVELGTLSLHFQHQDQFQVVFKAEGLQLLLRSQNDQTVSGEVFGLGKEELVSVYIDGQLLVQRTSGPFEASSELLWRVLESDSILQLVRHGAARSPLRAKTIRALGGTRGLTAATILLGAVGVPAGIWAQRAIAAWGNQNQSLIRSAGYAGERRIDGSVPARTGWNWHNASFLRIHDEQSRSDFLSITTPNNDKVTGLYGALHVPPELSSRIVCDPRPRMPAFMTFDQLGINGSPADDMLLVRRHRRQSPSVIELRNADLKTIQEVWNVGHIYSIYKDPASKLVLAVIASNALPQSFPGFEGWETNLASSQSGHRYPMALVGLLLEDQPSKSALFPKGRADTPLPTTSIRLFLAQGQAWGGEDCALLRTVEAPRGGHPEAIATVTIFGRQDKWSAEFEVRADGSAPWETRFVSGDRTLFEKWNAKHLRLQPIDTDRWSAAVQALDVRLNQDPRPDVASVALQASAAQVDQDARQVADRRASSPYWLLGKTASLVMPSTADSTQLDAALHLLGLLDTAIPKDWLVEASPCWSEAQSLLAESQFFEALIAFRRGDYARARQWVPEAPPDPRSMALAAMVYHRLGDPRALPLVQQLRSLMIYRDDLPSLRVLEDAPVVQLAQEAEQEVAGCVSIRSLEDYCVPDTPARR